MSDCANSGSEAFGVHLLINKNKKEKREKESERASERERGKKKKMMMMMMKRKGRMTTSSVCLKKLSVRPSSVVLLTTLHNLKEFVSSWLFLNITQVSQTC